MNLISETWPEELPLTWPPVEYGEINQERNAGTITEEVERLNITGGEAA